MRIIYKENSGYIGNSRSVRSQQAIDSYEIPLSLINKDIIGSFINDNFEDRKERDFLYKVPVGLWKFSAIEKGASSWHHTSSFYNKTNHFNLFDIADFLLTTDFRALERKYKDSKRKIPIDLKYGVLEFDIWGGTRRHPVIIGQEEVAGIIKGDWLHTSYEKHKINARKTVWCKQYDTYTELTRKHPQYRGQVKYFNQIIKNLI